VRGEVVAQQPGNPAKAPLHDMEPASPDGTIMVIVRLS